MHRLPLWYFMRNLSSVELYGVRFNLHLGRKFPRAHIVITSLIRNLVRRRWVLGGHSDFIVFSPYLLSFFIVFCEYSPKIIIKLFKESSLCYKSDAAIWVVSKGSERRSNPHILFPCACLSEVKQASNAIFY